MSRRYALGLVLVGLLLFLALTSCLFAICWYVAKEETQRLQARADAMNRTSTLVQQLATESVEYGRQNPAINTLLQQLNIRPVPSTTTALAPGPSTPTNSRSPSYTPVIPANR